MEDDLLNRFGALSVRHSKTWTMGEQAMYKDAFKASEKESNFFDAKRDGGLETWVGFNPSRVGKEDRCGIALSLCIQWSPLVRAMDKRSFWL